MAISQGIWTVCDVCGRQIPVKEAILVTDKYSLQNGLVVCRRDLDPSQTLLRPVKSRETPPAPGKLRKPPSGIYNDNPNSDKAPIQPQRVIAFPHPINNTIMLRWEGPLETGSDRIIGYRITRASPQLAYQLLIEDNTGVGETFFEDLTGDVAEDYTYTVAAINQFGIGEESELTYYPSKRVNLDVDIGTYKLLIDGETNYTITDGDGNAILVSST